ncbi:MAG: GAF domain-containing protein [Deltaproteobacteria bacterium]|nr:GAF domain-containing protein [Deltaproteobacteria bacterium]
MPGTTDYFKKLCEICQAFGTARNRRELLEMIFASAMEILEGKAACLYLMEPGKPELMPVAHKGLSESYFRSKKSMLVQKLAPLVLEKGFFYSRDAATDPTLAYPDAKKAEGIASILAAPVMVKGKNIGVFCLFTATPKDFTPEEKDFLSLLAQQGGGVMEHARLIDHLHRETQLFFDLAVNLSGSLEVKEILHAMTADLAKSLVGVKGASIRLLNEAGETLELVASFGLSKKYLQKGPVSAQKSIAQAIKNGTPVIVLDAATDRRVQYRAMNKEEGIVTILAVPIKTKEKVIGVLRLYSKTVRHFTAEEIKLVTALAYLGGLAIQNASLYLLCQTEMKDLQAELWSHRSWF